MDTIQMFKYHNCLGFNTPYYFTKEAYFEIHKTFPEIINSYGKELLIDPVAVIEVLNKNFIFADRTLVQNIHRTPFLAKPNKENNDWIYDKIPRFGISNISEEEIANTLFQKICIEIEEYIGAKKRIGVLLSGGMDSRIVAGALDFLIKAGKLKNLTVVGLTWGNEDTRDVVYAQEIAKRLGWQWNHYTVGAKSLLDNITEAALAGCEFSPIHLHAIPQIRDSNKYFDVILAGSYGDSIGRAEYFGWKAKNLPDMLNNISGHKYFVHKRLFNDSLIQMYNDIEHYHSIFPLKDRTHIKELDYQIHYMRRMLNPCMSILDTNQTRFYQVFTSPIVYGFIWEISISQRTDLIYQLMINAFSTNLSDIPWARTGLKYGEKRGKPDAFKKNHHTYISIILDELLGELEDMVLSPELERLNVFNFKSIEKIFSLLRTFPQGNLIYIEKLVWMASLAKMVNHYNIKGVNAIPLKVENQYISLPLNYFKAALRNKLGMVIKKHFQL